VQEVKLKKDEIDWGSFNFREEVSVDRYRVEEQLAENPSLFAKYAEAYAEATLERDRAEDRVRLRGEEVKEEVARLDGKCRSQWQELKDDGGKVLFVKVPSETSISQWIILQPEYRKVQDALRIAREEKIEWTYVAERLSMGVKAFDNRKFTLDGLGNLLVKGIYSYSTRGAAGKEMTERIEGKKELAQSEGLNHRMSKRPTMRPGIK
jgi:hypothetical protein